MSVKSNGESIKKRRKELSITQPHLAELANISTNTLYKLERGMGNPSLEAVYQYIEFLDARTSVNYLLSLSMKINLRPKKKYPPSLQYLLMTLGPALIFLANSEKMRGKVVVFFSTFGRVPFFYYIIHLYLIHLLALAYAELSGFGWRIMILENWVTKSTKLQGYGVGLIMVYMIWIFVIAALYPLCRKYDQYKQNNKQKWWLSYL